MPACLFHRVRGSKLHLLLNSGKNAALIPPKPVQKILKGDYVDMHELLPVTWRAEEQRSCEMPAAGLPIPSTV